MSFDLFDTLLRRHHLKVNEVHDTVSAYVLARCGRRGVDSPFHLTLLRYQASDALKSFDGTGTQEPLLADVWERLLPSICDNADECSQIAADAVAFELDIERANLALIDGAEELLRLLRARGKRVIAISDMYFDKPTMEGILAHLGILDLFDHVYVSAQSRLTKQTGNLFRLVLGDLGLDPAQVIHVGDNARSDIEMANAAGIEAVHVLQEHLTEIERCAYGARPRIEEEVADLTKAHLLSILFDCVSSRSDHLYFLARDGAAIHRFLDRWDNPLIRRFLPAPPHSDIYLNRILTCWGRVDFSGDWLVQTIGLAFWLNHGEALPADLFAQLGLGKPPRTLGTRILYSNTDTFRVAEAITAAGLTENVRAHIMQMRRNVIAYLTSISFFNHRTATFSDIGYSGTVLRDLNSLFVSRMAGESERDPPQMTLHLIATNDNYAANAPRTFPYVRFAPQAIMLSHDLPEDLKGSFAWLEFFYKHPTLQPILKFATANDGTVHPELRHAAPSTTQIPTDRVIDLAAY